MANESVNNSPNMQDKFKRTPTDIMFNTQVQMNIKHWHPFARPAYVLDNKLQDEKRIYNKWKSGSKVGIYLGHSPLHARNIALILNLETGMVSPQFHVRYDKTFETIKQNAPHHRWLAMAVFQAVTPSSQDASVSNNKRGRMDGKDKPGKSQKTAPLDTVPQRMHPNNENDGVVAEAARADPSKSRGDKDTMMHEDEILYAHQCMITEEGLDNHLSDIHAYKATSDPDTLYYHQAMKESDADEFRVAMRKEWEDQRRNGNFEIIRRSEVPNGSTILPSVWQMRRKREISTGKVKKYKAKLNLDGSRMQKGIDYQHTYAPVVKWSD